MSLVTSPSRACCIATRSCSVILIAFLLWVRWWGSGLDDCGLRGRLFDLRLQLRGAGEQSLELLDLLLAAAGLERQVLPRALELLLELRDLAGGPSILVAHPG